MEAFLQRLRQRRVDVDVAGQLSSGEVPLLRQGELGHQFRDIRPDQVRPEQFAVLAVGDHLDEAGRVGQPVRLPIGGERELGDLDVIPLSLGLFLGEPEAGDLRLAERRARHHAVVAQRHRFRSADRLGRHHAHRLGDVGQLQLGGDIADGVDVRNVGAHVVIDGDGTAVGQRHPGRLQPVAGDVGREADCLHHLVGLEFLARAVLAHHHGDRRTVVGDGLHLRTGEDLDAEFLVLLLDLLGNLGILVGQCPR